MSTVPFTQPSPHRWRGPYADFQQVTRSRTIEAPVASRAAIEAICLTRTVMRSSVSSLEADQNTLGIADEWH